MKFKKLIAVICSAAVLFNCAVFAAETEQEEAAADDLGIELAAETQIFSGGSGTKEDPFLISTEDQFDLMNDFLSYSYKLTNDIELTSDREPIEFNGNVFSGTFDGAGHTISGLNIDSNKNNVGFFGINKGIIKNLCVRTKPGGKVASSYYGGYGGIIAGYNYGTIENCYVFGEVSAYYAGSICGGNNGSIKNCYSVVNFSSCHYTGGICYYGGTVSNCYYDRDVSGFSSDSTGVKSKGTLAMKMKITYEGWDFDNTWGIDSNINDGYPYLLAGAESSSGGSGTQIFSGGSGTKEDPFLISTEDQFDLMNDFLSYSYKLTNDIELTSDREPIEFNGNVFSGTFDGAGHTISGLNIDSNKNNVGFFGINKGIIKNLCVRTKPGGKVASSYYGGYGGIIAGYNYGTIENCYVFGEVSAYYAGSICGGNNGSIKNCYSVVNFSSCHYTGGICYYGGTVSNCYYDRDVSGFSSDSTGVKSKGTLAMKMKITYEGWDFDSTWGIDSNINDGYPYLLAGAENRPESIVLNQTGLTLAVGETFGLNAAVTPADYSGKILWKSSNGSVASVSDTGTVTAKAVGSAVITASTGGLSASCNVQVADNAVRVTGMTLNKTSLDLVVGEETTLTATITPDNATNKTVNWKNLNPETVSFDANTGRLTALAVGHARITAATADGGFESACDINVYDNSVKVTSVTLDKSETGIGIGETVQLKATVLPENATNKNIKWTTLNPGVATVSDQGLVTGIAEGTTQIYATSASNSQCYAICRITVAKQKVPVTGIELANNAFGIPFEVNIGKSLILSPTVKPANATNKDIIWTSSDSGVADVKNGMVTGISEGSVTITATTVDGGFSASCAVNVTKPTVYVTGISVNTEQMTVNIKEQKKLQAAVTPADATDKTITFKSNNNAIATVTTDGTVTGISPGTTLIQAISDTNAGKFIAFCSVTVPKPVVEVTNIKLNKSRLEIVEGKTVPLKAVIKPSNATYKNITWSQGDESVATVDQEGNVTARGVGETAVSATAANGITTACNITVLPSDTPAQLKVENATVKAGKQVPITVSIASNPGISTFQFNLSYDKTKMYPVSYSIGDALKNGTVTSLLDDTYKDKDSVGFLCQTKNLQNTDTDGELVTIIFQTLSSAAYGDCTIGIEPTAFTNINNDKLNFIANDCTLSITDYTIGDVNCDDVIDLKDSLALGRSLLGETLSDTGRKAAVSIYPDQGDDVNTSQPSIQDFQRLCQYLADWQVELGEI